MQWFTSLAPAIQILLGITCALALLILVELYLRHQHARSVRQRAQALRERAQWQDTRPARPEPVRYDSSRYWTPPPMPPGLQQSLSATPGRNPSHPLPMPRRAAAPAPSPAAAPRRARDDDEVDLPLRPRNDAEASAINDGACQVLRAMSTPADDAPASTSFRAGSGGSFGGAGASSCWSDSSGSSSCSSSGDSSGGGGCGGD